MPNRPIWSATRERTPVQNALYHWEKHGRNFPELQKSTQYVEYARKFRDRTDVSTILRERTGERVVSDRSRKIFGVFTREGVPETIYRPDPKIHGMRSNQEYFDIQGWR